MSSSKKGIFKAILIKPALMIRPLLLAFSLIFTSAIFAQTSLLFDGVNEYVSSPFAGITGANDRTVEAWVKTSANTNSSQRVVVDWGVFSTGTRFTLNILNGVARVEVSGGGLNGTSNITDGQWHHLAVSFEGASAQPYKVYVDGTLEAEGLLSNNPTTNTSAGNFRIGARIDDVRYFLGEIDDVRVWSDVRTNAEIAANMNSVLTGTEPGLAAYFNMEGTTNTVGGVIDLVAGNNGTMINMEVSDIIISSVPLPIELVSFDAKYQDDLQGVALEWRTLSEQNNRFFSVERSKDGARWEEISQLAGAGSTDKERTYQTLDKSPIKGASYYRLKQTDFDGQSAHSDVKSVYVNTSSKELVDIYPNPTSNLLTLRGDASELEVISVYNVHGQLVMQQEQLLDAENGDVQVDLSMLCTGLYFIKTRSTTNRINKL